MPARGTPPPDGVDDGLHSVCVHLRRSISRPCPISTRPKRRSAAAAGAAGGLSRCSVLAAFGVYAECEPLSYL